MQAICKTKCYWREKLWKPGDTVTVSEAEADTLPRHFDCPGRAAAQDPETTAKNKGKKGNAQAAAQDSDENQNDGGTQP